MKLLLKGFHLLETGEHLQRLYSLRVAFFDRKKKISNQIRAKRNKHKFLNVKKKTRDLKEHKTNFKNKTSSLQSNNVSDSVKYCSFTPLIKHYLV